MKPSDFTTNPMGSVLQNSESETIARNIMVMLSRTGNTFREFTFEEYKTERFKDGAELRDINTEKPFFDRVIGYCVSENTAKLFSPVWKEVCETETLTKK